MRTQLITVYQKNEVPSNLGKSPNMVHKNQEFEI